MTSGEVADRLSVSAGTVRRWTDEFGDFLSASANPPKGEVRQFTDDDAEVLTAIAFYSKEQHLNYDAIRDKLEAGAHREEPIPTPAALRAEQEPAEKPPTAQPLSESRLEDLIAEVRAVMHARQAAGYATEEQVDTLQRQIEKLETQAGALSQIASLRRELEDIRKALSSSPIQSETVDRRLEQLQKQLPTRDQVEGLEQAFRQLRDTLNHSVLAQIDELRGSVGELRQALPTTQRQAQAVEQHIQQLRQDMPTRDQLRDLQAILSQLQTTLAQQADEYADLKRNLSEVGTAIVSSQTEQLREELASLEQAHTFQEGLSQVRKSMDRLVDEHQTLRQTIHGLRSAVASGGADESFRQLATRLDERMQQHQELVSNVQRQVTELEPAVASQEQVDELHALLVELRKMADERTQEEIARIQRLDHVEEEIRQVGQALEEQQAHRGVHWLYGLLNGGTGRMAAQTISWILVAIAALAVLYYVVIAAQSVVQ